MSRKLRTTVPISRKQRMPQVLDPVSVRARDEQIKARQKCNFDDHRGARELPPLIPGDTVWVPDRGTEARVEEEVAPQSYEITTGDGTYRRNRRALISIPETPGQSETVTTTVEKSKRRSGRSSNPPE